MLKLAQASLFRMGGEHMSSSPVSSQYVLTQSPRRISLESRTFRSAAMVQERFPGLSRRDGDGISCGDAARDCRCNKNHHASSRDIKDVVICSGRGAQPSLARLATQSGDAVVGSTNCRAGPREQFLCDSVAILPVSAETGRSQTQGAI
jgi:hypothetical protein